MHKLVCEQCGSEYQSKTKTKRFCTRGCYDIGRFGEKRSDETKKRISFSLTGKKRPYMVELNRRRLLGIPKSLEWKQKMSEVMKGRIFSKETRMKMSISGKKARPRLSNIFTPREVKQQIRKSIEYRMWRESVFKRDGYICQMPGCNDSCTYLEANHIKRFATNPELRFETSNGITLCQECHRGIRYREDEFSNLFNGIVLCR